MNRLHLQHKTFGFGLYGLFLTFSCSLPFHIHTHRSINAAGPSALSQGCELFINELLIIKKNNKGLGGDAAGQLVERKSEREQQGGRTWDADPRLIIIIARQTQLPQPAIPACLRALQLQTAARPSRTLAPQFDMSTVLLRYTPHTAHGAKQASQDLPLTGTEAYVAVIIIILSWSVYVNSPPSLTPTLSLLSSLSFN